MKGLNWKICIIYIDDCIIFSSTFDERIERLRLVFQRFRMASLKLKPKKCELLRGSVTFLGFMFHFMFVHYTFSSVWVAEWPPFGK